jgi:hypothetical protein
MWRDGTDYQSAKIRTHQTQRRHFVPWIHTVEPLGKEPDRPQTRRPGLTAGLTKRVFPFQEESGGDVIRSLGASECDEPPKDSCRRTELET